MIKERMLELILLDKYKYNSKVCHMHLDVEKMQQRYEQLVTEFLTPYVLTKTSNED